MTHAIEAYVSTAHDDYTDPYALEAIRLVFDYLERAVSNGNDMEARGKMHTASTVAGIAFSNCSLGIVHSMAHKIGGEFHLTHGEANAIMLPYIINYNRKETDRYSKLEGALGIDDIAKAVSALNRKVGITRTIQEGKNTVMAEEKFLKGLELMSGSAVNEACTLTNPRKTSAADIKKIYLAAYYGKEIDF